MHIAFAGGGTAGHVTPALSMADAILHHAPETEITFFISSSGVEKGILEGYPYQKVELPIHNLSRSLSWKAIRTAYEVPLATGKAMRYIQKANVDMVIGTGGYVAYPALMAAQLVGIPNYIHESNCIAGLVTRLTAKKATGILLNYEACESSIKTKARTHFVGNFIIPNEGQESRKNVRKRLGIADTDTLVLVMGGSLGAARINQVVVELNQKYQKHMKNIHFVISTGKKKHEETVELVKAAFGCLPQNIHLFPYLSPMGDYWRSADIAITRAGACTLSELCYYKVPAIVIPFPKSAKNHQKLNAQAFEKAGCGLLLEQEHMTADSLMESLGFLLSTPQARHRIICCQSRSFLVNRFDQFFPAIRI